MRSRTTQAWIRRKPNARASDIPREDQGHAFAIAAAAPWPPDKPDRTCLGKAYGPAVRVSAARSLQTSHELAELRRASQQRALACHAIVLGRVAGALLAAKVQ